MSCIAFRVNAPVPTEADIDLDIVLGTGVLYPISDWFIASFTISGNILNPDVYANSGATDMQIDGGTITRSGSDSLYFGHACSDEPQCSGASGQWLLVPEPETFGLLGIGLLGALLTRERRRQDR